MSRFSGCMTRDAGGLALFALGARGAAAPLGVPAAGREQIARATAGRTRLMLGLGWLVVAPYHAVRADAASTLLPRFARGEVGTGAVRAGMADSPRTSLRIGVASRSIVVVSMGGPPVRCGAGGRAVGFSSSLSSVGRVDRVIVGACGVVGVERGRLAGGPAQEKREDGRQDQ